MFTFAMHMAKYIYKIQNTININITCKKKHILVFVFKYYMVSVFQTSEINYSISPCCNFVNLLLLLIATNYFVSSINHTLTGDYY